MRVPRAARVDADGTHTPAEQYARYTDAFCRERDEICGPEESPCQEASGHTDSGEPGVRYRRWEGSQSFQAWASDIDRSQLFDGTVDTVGDDTLSEFFEVPAMSAACTLPTCHCGTPS